MMTKRAWMDRSWDASGVTSQQLQELGVSSIQELQAVRDARLTARVQLSEYLARPDVSGPEKQRARCAFIHKHGRLPYQCPGCWLLPGFCVCSKLQHGQPSTKVFIHLHQDEWGRGSNTGCLCAASLAGCQMLLRGHAPHDTALAALLEDTTYTTALLWPGPGGLEPYQLQALANERSGGRIALVAIDATWGAAVKMRRKYPPGVLTVRLPPDLALPQIHHIPATLHEQQQHQPHQQPELQQQQQQQTLQNSLQQQPQQQQQQQQKNQKLDDTLQNGSKGHSSSTHHLQSSNSAVRNDTAFTNSSGSNSATNGAHGSPAAAAAAAAVASDGTAKTARKGPRHIPLPGERVSLFRGVRKYHGKAAENGRVSTLEAVAAALLALEGDEGMHAALLHNLKLKVDAMRQQKHMPLVYGVMAGPEGEVYHPDGQEDDDSSSGL